MANAPFSRVHTAERDGVLTVRLCRMEHYNALDTATLLDLIATLDEKRAQPMPLVLEGDSGAFSIGADITELAQFDDYAATAYSHLGHQVVTALERWPGVTVAKLSGYVLGAGLELALGCDVLVAQGEVRIGLPGLLWAIVPCLGGMRRLACRVPQDLCSELFLSGSVLDADMALRSGLIDRLVDHDFELDALVDGWRDFSPAAVHAIRDLRLARQGVIDPTREADLFAAPFIKGECQRRLRELLAG